MCGCNGGTNKVPAPKATHNGGLGGVINPKKLHTNTPKGLASTPGTTSTPIKPK